MNSQEISQEIELLEIPLGIEAHRRARQFSAEQTTNEKGKQVYLNTLAVYAVHRYLQWLQIETDLSQSESWHPVLRRRLDVADLSLPGIGNLECRPVLPRETSLSLPPEVTEDRIGYLAVGLNESMTTATLLGFINKVNQETLPLSQLGSLEDFLEQINTLEPVHLRQFFEDIFKKGWKKLEPALSLLAIRFQPRVIGVKQINLGTQLSDCSLDLILTLTKNPSQHICIKVQVRSSEGKKLPEGLKLIVIDESGESFFEASTRINDNTLQTPQAFRGELKERFTLKVVLGEASFTEHFVI